MASQCGVITNVCSINPLLNINNYLLTNDKSQATMGPINLTLYEENS